MDKILRNTNIWDLHIHTPLGTPTKKNYGNASTEEFIDTIIDIYNKSNNKIGMISFTDHNKINADAYELFKIKSDIAIIPGIEVDVYLSEKDKDSKHIIFYFDEEELENIRELKTLVENYIESNEKVIFEDFIMYLVVKRKHFAVSPHAFKQGKRGIDNDWFDEERASRGANEFTGLIFPFWEAAGKTDICKAIEFLNEQYNDEYNNQSVIAFSDSADYKKLQNYINNPHQYFRCLNSFKGLLLAGSDPDRIIYENENRPLCNPSEKIKSIRLSNDLREIKKNNVIEIEFSDRLNAIVGGRGKGKRKIVESVNKSRWKGFEKLSNSEVFQIYATTSQLLSKLKDSIEFSSVIEDIDSLTELKSEKVQKIIYVHNSEYVDLHKTSPGMQTNAVMEYILHSESTIPLFIDQPEDNIDNEARYAQLTKWIRKQKYNRQIILVTHDANIVINGDAENVIIANHTAEKFQYDYGALEYGDILDNAAIILDGGKIAIHRRIEKYGE